MCNFYEETFVRRFYADISMNAWFANETH